MTAKVSDAEPRAEARPELRPVYVNPNHSSARMFVSSVVALVVHLAIIGGAALASAGQNRPLSGTPAPLMEIKIEPVDTVPEPTPPGARRPGLQLGAKPPRGPATPSPKPGGPAPITRALAPGPEAARPTAVQEGHPAGRNLGGGSGAGGSRVVVATGCGRVNDSEALFTLKTRMPGVQSCTSFVAGSTYTVSIAGGTISPSRESNKCAPPGQVYTILRSCH